MKRRKGPPLGTSKWIYLMHTYLDSEGNVVKATVHVTFHDAISLLQPALKSTQQDFNTLYPDPNQSTYGSRIRSRMEAQFRSNKNTINFDGGLKLTRYNWRVGFKKVQRIADGTNGNAISKGIDAMPTEAKKAMWKGRA
ncbi:hypothetical protein TrCOL_g4254, partial [Triparma columacea]